MKNKKTNWLIKHTLTVFSCVMIIVLGIAAITFADPVTTSIGENISTNSLTATGLTVNGTSTTTNLAVDGGAVSLPDNSITDAMLANDITASNYLPLSGGTMTGILSMGSYDIMNAGTITGTFTGNLTGNVTGDLTGNVTGDLTGTSTNAEQLNSILAADYSTDAERTSALESYLALAGGTVSGDLGVSGNTSLATTTLSGDLDLSGNELKNSILEKLADFPSSPVEGQMFYNTASDTPHWYNGSKWKGDVSGATFVVAASDSLHKENADYICDGTADGNSSLTLNSQHPRIP